MNSAPTPLSPSETPNSSVLHTSHEPRPKRARWPWILLGIVAVLTLIPLEAYRRYYWMRGDWLHLEGDYLNVARISFPKASGKRSPWLSISLAGFSGRLYPTSGADGYTIPSSGKRQYLQLHRSEYGHFVIQEDHYARGMAWRFPPGSLDSLRDAWRINTLPEYGSVVRSEQEWLETNPAGIYLLHRGALLEGDAKLAASWREKLASMDGDPALIELMAGFMDHDKFAMTPEEVANRQWWQSSARLLSVPPHLSRADTAKNFRDLMAVLAIGGDLPPPPVFLSFGKYSRSDYFFDLRAIAKEWVAELEGEVAAGRGNRIRPVLLGLAKPRLFSRMPLEDNLDFEVLMVDLRFRILKLGPLTMPWGAEQFESFWEEVDPELSRRMLEDVPAHGENWTAVSADWQTALRQKRFIGGKSARMSPDFAESIWWANIAENNLARLGIQCRHYRRLHGAWPAPAADGTLVVDGLSTPVPPFDPFGDSPTSSPLRARTDDHGDLVIYSIGPDKIDDHAALPYRPSAWTIEKGDIFLTLSQ